MKESTVKAFGPGLSRADVVVGVPDFITNDDRRLFLKVLLDIGFGVGRIAHQSALAVEAWEPLEVPEDEDETALDESTSLVVSLNQASLDLSVVSSSHGFSDRLVHETYPNLGQDFLDLTIAEVLSDTTGRGTIDGVVVVLHYYAPANLRRKRKTLARMGEFERECQLTFEDSLKMGKAETRHYQEVLKAVEAFTLKYGTVGQDRLMLSATSPIVFSGDADPSSFDMLARAFAKISPNSNFKIAQTATPAEIVAKGAAMVAKRKVLEMHEDLPLLPHDV